MVIEQTILFCLVPLFFMLLLVEEEDDDNDMDGGMMVPSYQGSQ
jgi:hypothetical protein